MKGTPKPPPITQANGPVTLWSEPAPACRDPTTSFLTATTLIYAVGAGITAAAGTRLALQLFLVKGFKVFSFRLPGLG